MVAVPGSIPMHHSFAGGGEQRSLTPIVHVQENGIVVSSMVENMVTAAQAEEGA